MKGEMLVMPHPIFRRYYKMKKFSEVDPEFDLCPRVREATDVPN